MSWREQLQEAAFRGVPFFVDGHEFGMGRRVQVHEFPLRDKPYAEDLGRKSRFIALDAYVLGADYMALRDRLMAALEKAGAGQLKHPYLGEMSATVVNCRMSESTAEGGMARFSLELVEAGDELRVQASSDDPKAQVAAAADHAAAAAKANFERRHRTSGWPAFVAQASQEIFGDALTRIEAAVALVRGQADAVSALQRDVDAARTELSTLIYTPASAGQALVSNIRQLVRSVATTPRDALSLGRTLYSFGIGLPAVQASTSSRKAQSANQAELVHLVRVTAAAEGARAASGVSFTSFQEALTARDEIVDTLDEVMLADGVPDELYDALRGLRSAVVRDIAARGANLARLVSWTPAVTQPSLVLAQLLYADAAREPELLTRNAIRHPLFVAGAQPLEVLADGR